ncbi:MAG: hydroxyacylglutathione hydrolase [Legionellales bacterium]|nr:hydroxyacylglutathione hydrolase [Legionellales bacterium]|tara:strand:+ start:859 stop:1602 length:744 start_codon:yes stop_codon:yes gene_type:complete
MSRVIAIPALQDNYIWIVEQNNQAVVVDPGESKPVLDYLRNNKIQPVAILITHHHLDHTGGIGELLSQFNIPVYGPAKEVIPHQTHRLFEKNLVHIASMNLTYQVIECPGHTLGHIAFYGHRQLFCGDTLFSGGCGRIFEGTHAQMYESLTKLSALPDDTQIFAAHEYTLSNLAFAHEIEPNNQCIQSAITKAKLNLSKHIPTLPSTIGREKTINPFLRCQTLKSQMGTEDEPSTFSRLREKKDSFR